MNRRLALIGIAVSTVYLGVGGYLLGDRMTELATLPLNNLGDFLAGAFGPLTIFWLVLGFFQQGDELRLNTRALELQAAELKSSVDQQRQLVELTQRDQEAKRVASQPKFVLQSRDARFPVSNPTVYTARIMNVGSTVTDIALSFHPPLPRLAPTLFPALVPGGALTFEFAQDPEEPIPKVDVTLSYTDSMGTRGEVKFVLQTHWSGHESSIEFQRAES